MKQRDKIYDTEDVDGGITKRTDTNAPKTINSKRIISFQCELSTVADAEESEFSGKNYKLYAVLNDGAVNAKYECCDRIGNSVKKKFGSTEEFMSQLYRVVSEYDLAKYNGNSYFVSGLPDMYGAVIDIVFDSGESIRARDNQNNFLTSEAVSAVVTTFEKYANVKNKAKDI